MIKYDINETKNGLKEQLKTGCDGVKMLKKVGKDIIEHCIKMQLKMRL